MRKTDAEREAERNYQFYREEAEPIDFNLPPGTSNQDFNDDPDGNEDEYRARREVDEADRLRRLEEKLAGNRSSRI